MTRHQASIINVLVRAGWTIMTTGAVVELWKHHVGGPPAPRVLVREDGTITGNIDDRKEAQEDIRLQRNEEYEKAEIGKQWTRDAFEVQQLAENKKWYTIARTAHTLEEAKEQKKNTARCLQVISQLIGSGKEPNLRIVHIKSSFEVVG